MIVYRHRRLDNNQIFYVGIGTTKYRATNKTRRSEFWKRIVSKTDYSVEIVAEVDTWELACDLEQLLIQEYGRINLGTGTLCNLTDGGEGAPGRILTEEHKSNISKSLTGRKHSQETIDKISKTKKGTVSPKGKKVINTETNIIYNSIAECCKINSLSTWTMSDKLNNKIVNDTPFRFYNQQ